MIENWRPGETCDQSLDAESFYQDKISLVYDVVSSTPRYSPAMVNSWLSDIEEERNKEILNKNRLSSALTGSEKSRETCYRKLLYALQNEVRSEDVNFRKWIEEFEEDISYFSQHQEMEKLSVNRTPPGPETKSGSSLAAIAETADEYFRENGEFETVLGHTHYRIPLEDPAEFNKMNEARLSALKYSGYIGKTIEEGNHIIYIRKDLVNRLVSTEPDSNPYTI